MPKLDPGTVYLVGAGPGDPGLITMRAVECLGRADVIIYDYLANPAALQHAPESAKLVCLGHHSSGRVLSPDEIIARSIEEARNGKTVVRLKGGDPSIFGRGADECRALRDAGIPFEVVPGITAAVAMAAFCEIPITHHDGASAVALVAGHERDCKTVPRMDYGKLADFPGTLILYMGVTRAALWSRALIDGGKPPDTPVAIVRWCSWPKQEIIRCTLATVVEVIEQRRLRPPALFVIGQVIDSAPEVSWFAARPLFGARILVPGSAGATATVAVRLRELGADIIRQPVTRVIDPTDFTTVDRTLNGLDEDDCIVFSSRFAVDRLVRRLLDLGHDLRRLGGVKLAAVDTESAERLSRYNLRADLVLEQTGEAGPAKALSGMPGCRRFLLAGSTRDDVISTDELSAAGAVVDRIDLCESTEIEESDPETAKSLASGEIDWIAVTRPSEARGLVRLFGDDLRKSQLASIDPPTSAALREMEHKPVVEASPHTATGLVDAITRARQAAE